MHEHECFEQKVQNVIKKLWVNCHSGSVVECLTQDRRATGSSLTGISALSP